jgi:predicted phosphodiesterase
MFKKFLQRILQGPLTRLANRFSSDPVKKDVFASLDALLKSIRTDNTNAGIQIPFELHSGRYIIFSDQHKGIHDNADDFVLAQNNYLTALDHYYNNGFQFINLGDCEELWENTPDAVMKMNKTVLEAEGRFLNDNRYYRVFGNHDLEWKYPFQQNLYLKPLFGNKLKIYEGLELQTVYNNKTYSIFLTHGHQGDKRSDGNPVSTWIVAAIWTPIQRFLSINVNTVANSFELVDAHNIMMHDWSASQQQLIFISGHTHKPVFASLDHIDMLNRELASAKIAADPLAIQKIEKDLLTYSWEYAGKQFVKATAIPSYFNTGCCCFNDGDITGIEIDNGYIRLIKWETASNNTSTRIELESSSLGYIFDLLPGA